MKEQKTRRLKNMLVKAARHMASMFLILVLTTGVLELTLRLTDPIGIAYFSEAERYFRAMQADDSYAYIHRPGYTEVLQGVRVSINSHGLRGPEFTSAKPFGTTRILILGDSVVFGWGVPQDSIFPIQLLKSFDSWPQRGRIEVIPAGVGSWNTRTEYEYLKKAALQFQPDILVLIIVDNDLEPKDVGHTDVSRELLLGGVEIRQPPDRILSRVLDAAWAGAVARSYVCQYVQYYMKLKAVRSEGRMAEPSSPQWQDARLALDGIVAICRKEGIDLVICLEGTSEMVKANPVLELYRKHLEGVGVSPLPLWPVPFSDKRYRNSPVDSHANATGHALIARTLYEYLKPIVKERLDRIQSTIPHTAVWNDRVEAMP